MLGTLPSKLLLLTYRFSSVALQHRRPMPVGRVPWIELFRRSNSSTAMSALTPLTSSGSVPVSLLLFILMTPAWLHA